MQIGLQSVYDGKTLKKCYFNDKGVMQTGWWTIKKNKYYFTSKGWAQTGWKTLDGKRYYFGSGSADGVMKTGFQWIGEKTYYLGRDGNMRKNGWYSQTVNKVVKHYYLGSKGFALTGINTINKIVYAMDDKGVRGKGWTKANNKWHYANSKGVAQKGWLDLDKAKYNKRYYIGTDYIMRYGLQTINKKKYYFGGAEDGQMKFGWQTINSKKYYFDSKGIAKKGWFKENKKNYYFASSGEMQTKWLTIGSDKYYFGSNGVRRTGLTTVGTKIYYMNSSGVVQLKYWRTVSGNTYYFGSSGAAVKGWHKLKRNGQFKDKAYWNYFNEAYVLKSDSDIQGCTHGNSTFGDKKHLAGIKKLKYNLYDTGWDTRVRSAAKNWNNAKANVNMTEVAGGEDVSVRKGELDNAIGQAFFYAKAGSFDYYEIGINKHSWNRAVIILDSKQKDIKTATIAHEFGHTMGLAHRISEKNSIMCSLAYGRTATVPQKTDAENIKHIYK